MNPSILQAIKQVRITHHQQLRHSCGASLHAFSLILRTGHLFVHCLTMSGSVVCIPHGYMHNQYRRSIGKATNQRRMNDYFSPWKRARQTSTLPLRNTKSKEVA
ncbi:MAG TPA: hypothetical protein VEL31_06065 [Ktedonobacteraceae bacterium]|nr:hypothetical protein [Ktedonobacteraceae bacterium]